MNNYTNILIVEDEVLIAEFLYDILISFGFQNIRLAHNATATFLEIEKNKPELILLDIRMKTKLEGIFIAEKINELYQIPFIFITAHSDTAIIEQALNTNPKGYIIKPFKKMDVFAAIQLAIKSKEKTTVSKMLVFKDKHSQISIPVHDILYVKSNGNYLEIVSEKKTYSIRNSMQWFQDYVSKTDFKKVHRSYIVNAKKVTLANAKSVFIGTIEIPVSRNLRFEF
jgi:two-component system, LytTR family, response regulator LytT